MVIAFADFSNAAFQASLASFLDQASEEVIGRFAGHTNKARSRIYESRETVDPSFITRMLMTLLEVSGHQFQPRLLSKRVRDEVYWSEGAEKPWRRCAYWLVARVALQRHLVDIHGEQGGRMHYKFLICVLLDTVLNEAIGNISPEYVLITKAKLARRLAKLENESAQVHVSTQPTHQLMFAALGKRFHESLEKVHTSVEESWAALRRRIRKPIRTLPRRAGARDTYLTLSNSGSYIQQVLGSHSYMVNQSPMPTNLIRHVGPQIKGLPSTSTAFTRFAQYYYQLSEMERRVEMQCSVISATMEAQTCIDLAAQINTYLNTVGDAYVADAAQSSIMILTVMDLWVMLDRCACTVFGLLSSFHPGIAAETLDVLQLPWRKDMQRLQRIQEYLERRVVDSAPSQRTIFDNPGKDSFAERYYQDPDQGQVLKELLDKILLDEQDIRRAKKMNGSNALLPSRSCRIEF